MAARRRRRSPSIIAPAPALLVDSSAFLALNDPGDQYHSQAVAFRDTFILRNSIRLFTTSYVYSETMSHLAGLVPIEVAMQVDDSIMEVVPAGSFGITQIPVRDDTVQRAMEIYYRYYEHNFSVTDCTAFVLMQEHKINAAFTFDEDYNIYSYRQGNVTKKFFKLPEMTEAYKASMIHITWR